MDENVLFITIIVLSLFVLAFFYNVGGKSAGTLTAPPNPDAEFGVVRRGKTSIRSVRPTAQREPSPPPPIASPPPPDREEVLKKAFSISMKNARSRKPNEEHIQISYNPKVDEPVNISSWKISNARGGEFTLGRVTNLPGFSASAEQDQLILQKGSKVNIITGQSPRGESFRLNKCAEYFKQFYSFVPNFSVSCPAPSREGDYAHLPDRCFEYLRGVSSCRIPTPPLDVGNECREYINSNISYNGCATKHRNDTDFYKNEWHVYLKRTEQLWSDTRDTIRLTDEFGNVIATLSYN